MKESKITGARKPGRADATHCVHAGEERHGRRASLTTDIAQTSVFTFPKLDDLRQYSMGKVKGFMYTRYGNPTVAAAEKKIAALEGAESCVVTASGMAAQMIVMLTLLRAGDELVSMLDVYGGTIKLFENILARFNVKSTFVPYHDLGRIERYFSRRTKALFLETPTNPTLRCVDIAELARKAHKRGITVVADNTFATPILQKPLELGADIVLHSATKYLGGHSDLTAGAIAGPAKLVEPARTAMLQSGGNLDPGASYLLIRGLKTLQIRVERACANAAQVAAALCAHPKVLRVMYPGLPGNEGHEVARRQMSDYGMMVSFNIKGGERAAERFIDALQLWYLAPSLGGVESTVSYPVLSSHYNIPAARLKLLDVSPATIRLSVGIEDPEDLISDLSQSLARA
ncbi:MAG: aminotransferase class I/II-fold pyridoxal phosphate-dependent enzyme [Acidobacteriia bacterium]|nr:aminotransferase class I/II-fold pyridoxal phosphate-dependent enzyme [Terriglobia bacterium]